MPVEAIAGQDHNSPQVSVAASAVARKENHGMTTGIVKWFDPKKGYGFITQDNGEDVFVHWRQIATEDSFKTLQDGEQVEFQVVQAEKGPQAERVTPVSS